MNISNKLISRKYFCKLPLITLGSPYGIGYEIFLNSLGNSIYKNKIPFCIGSKTILELFVSMLSKKINYKTITPNKVNTMDNINVSEIDFILINIDSSKTKIKDIRSISDELDAVIAYKSIYIGSELIKQGIFGSIVTLPVSKKNISLIDQTFMGHTEFFKERWNEKIVFMTFISDKMNILLLTHHIPLKQVSRKITITLVKKALKAALKLKEQMKITKDICVLGLNPHAGENGLLGNEEMKILKTINKFNIKNNSNIVGPIPSDTAFIDSNIKKYGLYIACYHDQALIPFKTFAFKDGVNLSFGMKYVRTSVDHGTAVDIIGKNIASIDSFINAYKLAVILSA